MYEEYRVGAITMTDRTNYIDRQTAYDVLTEFYHHTTDVQHNALREALNKVPSAEQHGEWIQKSTGGESFYTCSRCGFIAWEHEDTNYCPNCGARMDEVE